MNNFKLIMSLFLIAIVSGCASPQAIVSFDENDQIDTSHYKTFAWLTEQKIVAPPVDFNLVMKERLDKEIEATFISQGYQFTSDVSAADFAISYSVINQEKVKVHHYPRTYRSHIRPRGRYYRSRINHVNETQVTQYNEGKLTIDIYDVKSDQSVWHGWATKRLTKDDLASPTIPMQLLIQQVVEQF